MPVAGLRLECLRCFEWGEVDFGGAPTILSGMNGSGKTTLLEALYLLARGRSFRTGYPQQLTRHGCKAFGIEAVIPVSQGFRSVRLIYDQKINITIDRQTATTREVSEILPLTLLEAGITEIVLGGPEQRRKLLDWLMFHVEQEGWSHWKQYRRALRQWQWALRTGMDGTIWIERMMERIPQIEVARKRLIEACMPFWQRAFEALFPGIDWSLDYRTGIPSGMTLEEAFQNWNPERAERPYAPGPHRADIEIGIDGVPARQILSRGQAKLLATGLMWGGAHLLARHLGAAPLLLIDDFSSELDGLAQIRLLNLLAHEPVQVVVTTVQPPRKEDTPNAYRLFHVEHGCIRTRASW
ncbi:recombination protein F [mine drainage metagenome]|uniref:Recombination protein F n=1 Tax=mine drainage metagenome TaxID=410659 RepID=T1C860_9ZZZZ